MVASREGPVLSASNMADTMDEAASLLCSLGFLPPRAERWRAAFSEMYWYFAVSAGSWMRRSPLPIGRHGKIALRRLAILEDCGEV